MDTVTLIRSGIRGVLQVCGEGWETRIHGPRGSKPQLVRKRQTRLAGLDDKILALYAGGMAVRDISSHLSELYGTEIGRDTVSRITDAVLEDVAGWRSTPLDSVYPIVYLDAMVVKVREDRSVQNRACYTAVGVNCDGDSEVLGIWWQDTEGAKFWLSVLNDLRRRGVQDVLICCVDGLTGFPEAIEAIFPLTTVQTCIVHLIRSSLKYVPRREREQVARDLKPIYTAINADHAQAELETFDEKWGTRFPVITQAWLNAWEHVIPFLAFPAEVRRVIYTTDESVKSSQAPCACSPVRGTASRRLAVDRRVRLVRRARVLGGGCL